MTDADRKTTSQTASQTPSQTPGRRGFFTKLAVGTAAAAVAAVAAKPEHAEAVVPPAGKGGSHYRESEHVKQYYRVNRY